MTYGPNTPAIETLLTRIRALTQQEAEALAEAQDAAQDADQEAAWEAAWHAAWEAARHAAREAAWYEVWHAAWGAARHAAWDAVCALVVRDLIDEDTDWNQQTYDTLTSPWRSVIGPLPNKDTP